MQHDRSTENNIYFIFHSIIDKYQHSQQCIFYSRLYCFAVGTLKVHFKSSEVTVVAVLAEGTVTPAVRVGRLCGPRSPEPKPFGQANLVALGPEIAQTRLPWLPVTVLICYTFWIFK